MLPSCHLAEEKPRGAAFPWNKRRLRLRIGCAAVRSQVRWPPLAGALGPSQWVSAKKAARGFVAGRFGWRLWPSLPQASCSAATPTRRSFSRRTALPVSRRHWRLSISIPARRYEINITGNITLGVGTTLPAINTTSPLIISGNNFTINGGGVQRGFFVYAGTVAINNLAITNAAAVGGNSSCCGAAGGGMGAGGALFVASGASVTVSNVSLFSNSATGGAGGTAGALRVGGGGGGLGGNGGNSCCGAGGGGVGLGGNGGSSGNPGAAGIVIGASGGGAGTAVRLRAAQPAAAGATRIPAAAAVSAAGTGRSSGPAAVAASAAAVAADLLSGETAVSVAAAAAA